LLYTHNYTGNVPQDSDLIGYVPSGIASILRIIAEVPITSSDILVDVGAGLGKVAMAAHLLSGARTRGIEWNPELVEHATSVSTELGLGDRVSFVEADARDTDIGDATMVFMCVPFRGAALRKAMRRLEEAARRHPLVVCGQLAQ
jgi:predicted RNA methylase